MKKLLKSIIAIAVLFSASHAFAQDAPKSPQDKAWNQTQWMKKNIAVTDEQTQKVFPILMTAATEMEKLKTAPAGPESPFCHDDYPV